MFELHPAVQRLSEKGYEGATLDEMAIVNAMRQSLDASFSHFQQIKVWLQQENPLGLRGQELSEWATEVAAWVLPQQMRRKYAPETRKRPEDGQPEHQDGDESRQASEASGGHSFTRSGKGEIPFIAT